MARKIREPRAIACRWGNFIAVQDLAKDLGPSDADAEAESRRASAVVRNVYNVEATVQRPPIKKGGVMLDWLRLIIRLLKGELQKNETHKSEAITKAARESIDGAKAMLDGEEEWLIPDERSKVDDKLSGC